MEQIRLKGGLIFDGVEIICSYGDYSIKIDNRFIEKHGEPLTSTKSSDDFNTAIFPCREINSQSGNELFSVNINGEVRLKGEWVHKFDVKKQ